MAKVDLKSYNQQQTKLERLFDDLPQKALEVFQANTAYRTGNARRSTKLQGNKIVADYPYSQRLDEGYSRQRPQGMTGPTEQWIQEEVARRLEKL